MSAEHTGQSPCPCRGCTTAYKAGYTARLQEEYVLDDGDPYREAYRKGYTAGYNEAMRLHQNLDVVDWVYGYDVDWGPDKYNQHGKGENP